MGRAGKNGIGIDKFGIGIEHSDMELPKWFVCPCISVTGRSLRESLQIYHFQRPNIIPKTKFCLCFGNYRKISYAAVNPNC